MAKQTQAPLSTGGIMRYFSDYKSKILIKPGYVILLSIMVIVTVIMLHALKP
jgi:preprotein translocase subunit Sec61beta